MYVVFLAEKKKSRGTQGSFGCVECVYYVDWGDDIMGGFVCPDSSNSIY